MNSSIPFKESKSDKKQVVPLPNGEIYDSRKRPFYNSVLLGVMGRGVAMHPKNKKNVL